jgi:Tol biopolymer transport system component
MSSRLRPLLVLLLLAAPALYPFGKNKIAYDRFQWQVYHTTHFSIHFYPESRASLDKVASMAESAYDQLSRALNHKLEKPIPFIIYRTHSEFEQTNVLLGFIPEGVGAFAEPVRNRMVMPIDLPDERLQKLILHELTHIFQFDLFFQGQLGKALFRPVPQWLTEGMASFMAKDENAYARMFLRDYVVNDRIPSVTAGGVSGYMAYRFGHAVLDFMTERWGEEGFRRFLYEYRSNLDSTVEKALRRAFDMEPFEFDRQFRLWMRERFLPALAEWGEPEQYGRPLMWSKKIRGIQMLSPALFPSGELLAAVTTYKGDIDVAVFTMKGSRVFRNLTPGLISRFDYLSAQFVTMGPEMGRDLAVSPDGDTVAFFGRKEKDKHLFLVALADGRTVLELPLGVDQPSSPAFAPDGRSIVFGAFQGNRGDLFRADLETRAVVNLTNDDAYDGAPAFTPDGSRIAYTSYVGGDAQLFLMDPADPAGRRQLTFSPGHHSDAVFTPDGRTLYYTWDREDYPNIYRLDLESRVAEQVTAAGTGCFQPDVHVREDGKTVLVFTGFYKGLFQTYLAEDPKAIQSFDEDPVGPVKAEPFLPAITVPFDESKLDPRYRPRLRLADGSLGVGVSSDQRIIGETVLRFSDLIGSRYLMVYLQAVNAYSDTQITYLNMARRTQWGFTLYDNRQYYLTYDYPGDTRPDTEQGLEYTGGYFFLQHPFSLYTRASAGLGYEYYSQQIPTLTGGSVSLSTGGPVAYAELNGDNTVWGMTSPAAGRRYQLTYMFQPPLDEETGFTRAMLDYRQYWPLTLRSQVAVRVFGFRSAGNRPTLFAIGGADTLRGYEYRSLFGTQGFFANLELRFPLVDYLYFPFGGFQQIRGRLFADLGGAWFPEDGFRFSEDGDLEDARASYGFGFTVQFLGLDWNWDWARRWNYEEPGKDMYYSFWIGYTF